MGEKIKFENEIINIVSESDKEVVVDNDFVRAHGVNPKLFDNYSKEELISALYVLYAILKENEAI